MRLRVLLLGVAAGLVLAVAGFGLRLLGLGLAYPVEGLYGRLTHFLGVPAVFNLVHRILGYSALAKNLAFAGAVVLWLALHALLVLLYRRFWFAGVALAAVFYGLFGGWLSAVVYGLAFWGLAWSVVRLTRTPTAPEAAVEHDAGRRAAMRTLATWALALPVVGALAALTRELVAQTQIVWERVRGLSKEITPQAELYYVSKNPAFLDPSLKGGEYRLRVDGMVRTPLTLTLAQLEALPSMELINTLMCISNPVGGDLIGCPRWTGVALRLLLERAGMDARASWLVFEGADDYVESLPLAELPLDAMVAYAIDGEDLERKHGYPTRLLLPGRYGMKQPKWLLRVTAADEEELGFWAERGWSRSAVIRTMSRIDTPQRGDKLELGREVMIAGIAYAGGRAIERVEVSVDAGRTWKPAVLKPPVTAYRWRLWAYPWRPASKGEYTLVVRAVEAGGRVQDATRRDVLPDGATGYHRVRVKLG